MTEPIRKTMLAHKIDHRRDRLSLMGPFAKAPHIAPKVMIETSYPCRVAFSVRVGKCSAWVGTQVLTQDWRRFIWYDIKCTRQWLTKLFMTSTPDITPWSYPNRNPPIEAKHASPNMRGSLIIPLYPVGPYAIAWPPATVGLPRPAPIASYVWITMMCGENDGVAPSFHSERNTVRDEDRQENKDRKWASYNNS